MKTTSRPNKTARLTGTPAHRRTVNQLGKESRDLQTVVEKAEHKIELQAIQIKKLVDENSKLKSARWATEEFLQSEIRKLDMEVATLTEKLEKANKQLAWFRTTKFGSTSEQ